MGYIQCNGGYICVHLCAFVTSEYWYLYVHWWEVTVHINVYVHVCMWVHNIHAHKLSVMFAAHLSELSRTLVSRPALRRSARVC